MSAIGTCCRCEKPVTFSDSYINLAKGRIRHQDCKAAKK